MNKFKIGDVVCSAKTKELLVYARGFVQAILPYHEVVVLWETDPGCYSASETLSDTLLLHEVEALYVKNGLMDIMKDYLEDQVRSLQNELDEVNWMLEGLQK